jgi:AcrR family transcriptional regulator
VEDRKRSHVAEAQRARIVAAATQLAYERGASAVTVSEVVSRAGLSRRSFYEIFAGAEECLLAALEEALSRARRHVLAARDGVRGGWKAQTRAGLAALLSFFDEHPQAAQLLVVESLLAGPRALLLREQVLGELAVAVRQVQAGDRGGSSSPELAGEALVGAALAILHRRLLYDAQRRREHPVGARGRRRARNGQAGSVGEPAPPVGRLFELTGPLMSMIVLPSLGAAAARRELARPLSVPQEPNGTPSGGEGVLGPPGVRLTHRTLLVLSAIERLGAELPGPSNRQIARAAGISDQGQASKLLARLRLHGLIESSGGRGLANAWRLTAKGEAIVCSLPQAGVAVQ